MIFLDPDFWRGLVSIVYFLVSAAIVLTVAIVLWKFEAKKWLWLALPITIVAVAYLPVSAKLRAWWAEREFAEKSAAQIAHFEMRCKSAGEFIQQTIQDVEGVFVIRPRVKPRDGHYQSQFDLWDPYGTSLFEGAGSTLPIGASLLSDAREWASDLLGNRPSRFERYLYVESDNIEHATDPGKPAFVRYAYQRDSNGSVVADQGNRRADPKVLVTPVGTRESQFGYTWEDISSREDREHWIAGSRLRVVELSTGRVVAERVGYMREPELGSVKRNRLAWSFATKFSCPPLASEHDKDKNFLKKVLIPR